MPLNSGNTYIYMHNQHKNAVMPDFTALPVFCGTICGTVTINQLLNSRNILITNACGSSSVGRASASQAEGRGSQSHLPLLQYQGFQKF